MNYIIKIPIYETNWAGRAENGNTILEHRENSREKAIEVRDKLKHIYNKETDLSEEEYDYLQEILDWRGHMIAEPYINDNRTNPHLKT